MDIHCFGRDYPDVLIRYVLITQLAADPMKETVTREWIEGLIRKAKMVDMCQVENERAALILSLLGYIESAEWLINQKPV